MNPKRKSVKGVLSAALIAAGLAVLAPASPAFASYTNCNSTYMCGFDQTSYFGTKWMGNGTKVDVPDNLVKSAANRTLHAYRAMNVVSIFSSEQLIYFPSGYLSHDFGSASNKTDHFSRVV